MLNDILRNDLNIEHTVLEIPTDKIPSDLAEILDKHAYNSIKDDQVIAWYFDSSSIAFQAIIKIQAAYNKVPYRLLTHTREDVIFVWQWPETWEERHMRISRVQIAYYKQYDYTPTEEDYNHWLDGLDGAFRDGMKAKGFEGCKTTLPFQRFYFEYRHDHGMTEYMKRNLSDDDFKHWNSLANE